MLSPLFQAMVRPPIAVWTDSGQSCSWMVVLISWVATPVMLLLYGNVRTVFWALSGGIASGTHVLSLSGLSCVN